ANETIQVTSAVTSNPRTSTIVATSNTKFDGSGITNDDDDDTNRTRHVTSAVTSSPRTSTIVSTSTRTIQVTSAVTSSPRTSTIVSTSRTAFDRSGSANETIQLQALLHPVLEQVLLFLLVVRNLMEAE
ncbi:unnamed protein product, partial [Tenebrio molitor]